MLAFLLTSPFHTLLILKLAKLVFSTFTNNFHYKNCCGQHGLEAFLDASLLASSDNHNNLAPKKAVVTKKMVNTKTSLDSLSHHFPSTTLSCLTTKTW